MRYLGVGTGDMEKGAMRCEVNLSLTDPETGEWGTKVEVKNLNSFRTVRNAIQYEIERQGQVLDEGGRINQVTMGWDESRQITFLQREKEGDTGYRYFPEPDLPPLDLDPAWIADIERNLPELPEAKLARYTDLYDLTETEAAVLVEDRTVAEYFERIVVAAEKESGVTPKLINNWISGELFRLLSEQGSDISQVKIEPADFVALIKLVNANTINQPGAKKTFAVMFESGRPPQEIVEELGLQQISDEGALVSIAQKVISDNPKAATEFRDGKEKAMNFLVGQIMRATRGKANPKVAEQILREQLQET